MNDGYIWTKQAIYCYLIKRDCNKCSYNIPLESTDICNMKFVVYNLLEKLGKPKENLILAEYGLKRCSVCGKIKKIEEYHKPQFSYCMKCANSKGKIYRERKKQKTLNLK